MSSTLADTFSFNIILKRRRSTCYTKAMCSFSLEAAAVVKQSKMYEFQLDNPQTCKLFQTAESKTPRRLLLFLVIYMTIIQQPTHRAQKVYLLCFSIISHFNLFYRVFSAQSILCLTQVNLEKKQSKSNALIS